MKLHQVSYSLTLFKRPRTCGKSDPSTDWDVYYITILANKKWSSISKPVHNQSDAKMKFVHPTYGKYIDIHFYTVLWQTEDTNKICQYIFHNVGNTNFILASLCFRTPHGLEKNAPENVLLVLT